MTLGRHFDRVPIHRHHTRRTASRNGLSSVDELVIQLKLKGVPEPVREFKFDLDRRWRFDLAWPDLFLAVEVDGAVWTGGRHNRGAGYIADMEKLNTAAIQGWRCLRFTTHQAKSGEASVWIEEFFAAVEKARLLIAESNR